MKTAEEILYDCTGMDIENHPSIAQAMKEYAIEVARESLKNAADNAITKEEIKSHKPQGIRRSGGSWREISVDKQSILDERNIPEL